MRLGAGTAGVWGAFPSQPCSGALWGSVPAGLAGGHPSAVPPPTCPCSLQIVAALDANPTTKRTQLQHKFEQVIALMEDNIYECCSEA